MPEDPIERHDLDIRKSLVLSLIARENLNGYKPSLDILTRNAIDLYGSATELIKVHDIFLSDGEVAKLTEQLNKDGLVEYQFVKHPGSLDDRMNLPIKVHYIRGIDASKLKVVYWDSFLGRKTLEESSTV